MRKVGQARETTQPKLPEPPPNKTAAIHYVWQAAKMKHQAIIDAFRAKVNTPVGDLESGNAELPSISYMIEWDGAKLMHAEAFLLETRWALKILEPLGAVKELPDDIQTLAKVQETLERVEERIQDELMGNANLGYAGDGPWMHNSTNPIANFAALAHANAKREVYVMCRTMLRLLDGQ